MVGLKKFLSNKNTVTAICLLLCIVVLYVAYDMRVKQAIKPKSVPSATETLSPGQKITSGVIQYIDVPPAMLKGNPIDDDRYLIGKYVASDTIIPIGSLFYKRCVVEEAQLADAVIHDIPDGYVLYNMSVDISTTYGNSIFPENYIDIYLKAINTQLENDDGRDKLMVGKLLENVKVIKVTDSAGQDVFANTDAAKTPSMVIFAVPSKDFILLKKAGYLRSYDTTLFPVPTNESLKPEPGDVKVSSDYLETWINNVTYWDESIG